MESFLSRSATDSGFQEDDEDVTWESVAGQAAIDDSLSSLTRPPSSLEPKLTRKEERKRMRRVALQKEVDEESSISLSDDDRQETEPASRKTSPSPTQFLQSKATGPLNKSRAMGQDALGNLLVFASPAQVLEAKENGASDDVPVGAVACVIASGASSVQRDKQGHPQGSSSFSFPSPTYNMPSAEHAQALQRNFAAELIRAGSERSPLLSLRIRFPQEPGTSISMSSPTDTRRNNLNSPLQVQDSNRTVDELRDDSHQFGEAGSATRSGLLQSEAQYLRAAQPCSDLAKGQTATLSMRKFSQPTIDSQDRVNAEHLQRMEADRVN